MKQKSKLKQTFKFFQPYLELSVVIPFFLFIGFLIDYSVTKTTFFILDPVPVRTEWNIVIPKKAEAAEEPTMREWIAAEIKNADLNENEALEIIQCESRFNPEAMNINPNKTYDAGIWQINSIHNISLMDRMVGFVNNLVSNGVDINSLPASVTGQAAKSFESAGIPWDLVVATADAVNKQKLFEEATTQDEKLLSDGYQYVSTPALRDKLKADGYNIVSLGGRTYAKAPVKKASSGGGSTTKTDTGGYPKGFWTSVKD